MTSKPHSSPSTITVHVPLKFTVRGGRKTIIGQIPFAATRTRFDESITKALARAYRWRGLIEDGTYSSITELAKDKEVNQSYACRLLRMTLLAPSIVESILDQRGTDLTLNVLMRPIPAVWANQRSTLDN